MLRLKNIKLGDLRNQSIISLANDLGCKIEYPNMPSNKYWCDIAEKINNKEEVDDELQAKFDEDQERVDKEWDKIFDNYMDSLVNWLDEHDYIRHR